MEATVIDQMATSAETIRICWKKGVVFWEGMTKNGIRLKLPFESEEEMALYLSRCGQTPNGKERG